MRNTDPAPEKFRGLGPAIPKPTPAPMPVKPQGPSGLVTENGMVRTTSHKPFAAMTLEEAIWNWRELYAEESRLDFLP